MKGGEAVIKKTLGIYGGAPKRIFDITAALAGLALASLPIMIAAAAVKMESGGPAFFHQERMGAGGVPFVCHKLRTMSVDAPPDKPTAQLDGADKYITRVGALLRKTSLDELPQLINVLRGEMSIVGPRPVICSEEELIGLRSALGVYGIRPGMTGLAQVRGRDNLSNRRKAALDAQYMEHMSLGGDVRLLGQTFLNVVLCRDVREGRCPKQADG